MKPVGGILPPSTWKSIMTDVTNRRFSAVAITIVHALGPTWQHFITGDASQIIAFPIDRTVYLRFVRAGGAAPALAVEIVDENR